MLMQNIKTIVSVFQGTKTTLAPSHFPNCSWISFIRKYKRQVIKLWSVQSFFTFQTELAKAGLDKGRPGPDCSEPTHLEAPGHRCHMSRKTWSAKLLGADSGVHKCIGLLAKELQLPFSERPSKIPQFQIFSYFFLSP